MAPLDMSDGDNPMELRALIVEDEPAARERLCALCGEAGFEVVACVESASEAIDALGRFLPNVLFLDVQLRGSSAFEVLKVVPEGSPPLVVFTSAHVEYAMAAFECAALDYLLKPFSDERFHIAAKRARARIKPAVPVDAGAELKAQWLEVLSQLDGRREPAFAQRLIAEKQQRFFFLDAADVESAVANRNCVTLTAKGETYMVRISMRKLEEKFADAAFVRIHKSMMINLDHVRYMERAPRGSFFITLRSGAEFRSSPIYRERILSGTSRAESSSSSLRYGA